MNKLSLALVISVLLFLPAPAQAYLDPGAGSMLLQVLLGGSAAVFVLLRLYWRRLLSLFGWRAKGE